jgi:selenocysteine lyase/cysteine desulfurase
VVATVDVIADLVPGSGSHRGTCRERLVESMTAVEAHEDALFGRLLAGLHDLPGVTTYGDPKRRTPTVLFSVDGTEAAQVHRHLAGVGVNAPASSFYALEASRHLGLGDAGAVRAGLAPYSTDEDVDRLLAGVAQIAS